MTSLERESPETILSVELDGSVITTVARAELPVDRRFSAPLRDRRSVLAFITADGRRIEHPLLFERGWAHVSVRVHAGGACQADCVISDGPTFDAEELSRGGLTGVRFQPFFAFDGDAREAELRGEGLFRRGLHFVGLITPGYVTHSCVCDACRTAFRLQSFHAGFGCVGYFYSASGVHTMIVPESVPGCPPALGQPDPVALAELERRLPPAPDGTTYSYLNPLRCPHCAAPYIDFAARPDLRPGEYYGNYLYGTEPQRHSPEPSPG